MKVAFLRQSSEAANSSEQCSLSNFARDYSSAWVDVQAEAPAGFPSRAQSRAHLAATKRHLSETDALSNHDADPISTAELSSTPQMLVVWTGMRLLMLQDPDWHCSSSRT